MPDDRIESGLKFMKARQARGLSVRRLSELVDGEGARSFTKFYDLEAGRRAPSDVLRRAYALHCEAPELLDVDASQGKLTTSLDDLLFGSNGADAWQLARAYDKHVKIGRPLIEDAGSRILYLDSYEQLLRVALGLLDLSQRSGDRQSVVLTALGAESALSKARMYFPSDLMPFAISRTIESGRGIKHVIGSAVYEGMKKDQALRRFIRLLKFAGNYEIRRAGHSGVRRSIDYLIDPERGALLIIPSKYTSVAATTGMFIPYQGNEKSVETLYSFSHQIWYESTAFFDIVDPSSQHPEGDRRNRVTRLHKRVEAHPGTRILIKDGVSDVHFPLDQYEKRALDWELRWGKNGHLGESAEKRAHIELDRVGVADPPRPSWLDDALHHRRDRHKIFMESLERNQHHEICTKRALDLFAKEGRFNLDNDEFDGLAVTIDGRIEQLTAVYELLLSSQNFHFWIANESELNPDRWLGASLLIKRGTDRLPGKKGSYSFVGDGVDPGWTMVYESRRTNSGTRNTKTHGAVCIAFGAQEEMIKEEIEPSVTELIIRLQSLSTRQSTIKKLWEIITKLEKLKRQNLE